MTDCLFLACWAIYRHHDRAFVPFALFAHESRIYISFDYYSVVRSSAGKRKQASGEWADEAEARIMYETPNKSRTLRRGEWEMLRRLARILSHFGRVWSPFERSKKSVRTLSSCHRAAVCGSRDSAAIRLSTAHKCRNKFNRWKAQRCCWERETPVWDENARRKCAKRTKEWKYCTRSAGRKLDHSIGLDAHAAETRKKRTSFQLQTPKAN